MTDIRARLPGNFNIRAQTLQTLQRSAVTDLAGGCLGLVDVPRFLPVNSSQTLQVELFFFCIIQLQSGFLCLIPILV